MLDTFYTVKSTISERRTINFEFHSNEVRDELGCYKDANIAKNGREKIMSDIKGVITSAIN